MSGYHCEILADSVNPIGQRVTTVQIRLPLVVWPEFLTHRTFSRNARSNRAVPSRVLIREVFVNPFVPEFWGRNQAGMQAGAELTGLRRWLARKAWLWARYPAIAAAWVMSRAGLHKQDANRVLNPWQWIDAVVTAGEAEWQAFFALRCHELADPKIQRIAEMICDKIANSDPRHLKWGQWHLPYYRDQSETSMESTLWASAGACARVSYACFDGRHSDADNAALGRRLANEKPAHASPLEHVLQAATVIGQQPGPVCGRWRSLRQIEGV
jgi:thymidylate synthase ThyX